MNKAIENFGPEFSGHAAAIINFMTEARRALDEKNGLTRCLECGDLKKTGEIEGAEKSITIPGCTRYFCANKKAPVRQGTFEEFENFGCPLGWNKEK